MQAGLALSEWIVFWRSGAERDLNKTSRALSLPRSSAQAVNKFLGSYIEVPGFKNLSTELIEIENAVIKPSVRPHSTRLARPLFSPPREGRAGAQARAGGTMC